MLLAECDTIVAVGAIIGKIPTLDGIDLSGLHDGAAAQVRRGEALIERG